MRFLKILGMVVALHVVLFTVFLLSPGCQSSPSTQAPAPAAEAGAPPASTLATTPIDEQENWSSQPTSVTSTISSAPLAGVTEVDGIRAAPSRPDQPETYVSTGDRAPPALNPPPTTHVIRAGDTFSKIAALYGTTTTALQRANPGVKANSLRVGQAIKLPAAITAPAQGSGAVADIFAAASTGSKYTVRSGDSLSAIAARNGTTVTALRQANGLRGDTIQVGQELIIPGGSSSTTAAAPAAPAPGRIAADASTTTFKHVIKSGESLTVIARRYDVTVQDIIAANNISNPRLIRAGQELVIPGYRGTGVPAPAAPAPAPAQPRPAVVTPPPAPPPAPAPAPAEPPIESPSIITDDLIDAPPIPVEEPVPTP